MNILKKILPIIIFVIGLNIGCVKDFLDMKPDKALVVPKTITELQALLDNGSNVINRTTYLTQIADADFEMNEDGITSLSNVLRNSYLWKKDIFEGLPNSDWDRLYQQIFYANIVLEGLDEIDLGSVNLQEFDHIKGSALFIRAHALYQAIQQFAAPYDSNVADDLAGVPVRTSSDVNIKAKRGTLTESYTQVVKDVNAAILLLPERSERKTRPSKAAAFALLARVQLIMGEYKEAINSSTAVLAIQNDLIDYNELDTTAASAFPNGRRVYNKEIIYYTDRLASSFYNLNTVTVDEELFKQYDKNDLRKIIFYNRNRGFKGSYGGGNYDIFTGLATDEVYLIRAESFARNGQVTEAMRDLNTLMIKRWKHSAESDFIPFTATSVIEALSIILDERRKELVTRGLRWSDLKRLNLDSRFQVTLNRKYKNEKYQLLPHDKRYVYPIPQNEIDASGIKQNER